jgi:AcrR family transcriptional regulator
MATREVVQGGVAVPGRDHADPPEARGGEQAAGEGNGGDGLGVAEAGDTIRRVSPPVLYDHFRGKQDLYRDLLERHFADPRRIWAENFVGTDSPERRLARSFDAWFAYIETHPFAGRMLFRDTSGDPEIAAMHSEVAARSRDAAMSLAAKEPGLLDLAEAEPAIALQMTWEVLRGVLQGLAMWWSDHPAVPREQVVAVAMNTLWVGFERVQRGEA